MAPDPARFYTFPGKFKYWSVVTSPRWLFTKQLRKIWCSGQEWVILHGTWVCANLFGCMTDLLINSDLLALFAIVKRPAKKVYLHLPIYHWQQITKLYCEVYEIIQRRKRRLKDGIWSGVVGVPKKYGLHFSLSSGLVSRWASFWLLGRKTDTCRWYG